MLKKFENKITVLNEMGPWITLDLSSHCDLKCIMCRAQSVDMVHEKFMDLALFQELLKNIQRSRLRFRGIKLSWLGEATLHPEFCQAIDMVSRFFPADSLALETNLQNIDEKKVNILLGCSRVMPVFITFSLDAISSIIYQKIRKGGSFHKTRDAIRLFLENRKKGDMAYFRYQFILMPENAHELDDFIGKFQEKGAMGPFFRERTTLPHDLIYIRKLVDPKRQELGNRLFDEALKKHCVQGEKEAPFKVASKLKIDNADNVNNGEIAKESHQAKEEKERPQAKKERPQAKEERPQAKEERPQAKEERPQAEKASPDWEKICTKPFTMLFIRPDGTIRLCDQDPEGKLCSQSVVDMGFLPAYLSGTAHDLRVNLLEKGLDFHQHCKNCPSPAKEIENWKLSKYLGEKEGVGAGAKQTGNKEGKREINDAILEKEGVGAGAKQTGNKIEEINISDEPVFCDINWSHQNSACLIQGGKVIRASESERIRRIRYYDDLDIEPDSKGRHIVKHRAKYNVAVADICRDGRLPFDYPALMNIDQYFSEDRPHCPAPNHHLAHAAAAFYQSGFERAAILTVDAVGFFDETATLSLGANGKIRQLASVKLPHSLGRLYVLVGNYLGLDPQPEGKVMALSSFGDDRFFPLFQRMVHIGKKGFSLNPEYIQSPKVGKKGQIYQPWLTEKFALEACKPRLKDQEILPVHQALAKGVQYILEEALLGLAYWLYELTGEKRLCYAGGVALNCVANRKLYDKGPFDQIFIPPACDDSGLAAGYALYHYHKMKSDNLKKRGKNPCCEFLASDFDYSKSGYLLSPNKAFLYALYAKEKNNKALMKMAAFDLLKRRYFYGKNYGSQLALGTASELFKELNMLKKSMECGGRALRMGANDLYIYLLMGELSQKMGKMQLAARYYRRGINNHPQNWEAWLAYGRFLMNSDMRKKALEPLRKAVSLSHGHSQALFELGGNLMWLALESNWKKIKYSEEGLEIFKALREKGHEKGERELERWQDSMKNFGI